MFESPWAIREWYEGGNVGWIDDPVSRQNLLNDGIVQYGAPGLTSGEGKRALLWRCRKKFDRNAYEDMPQAGPDCTSHGTANAIDTTRAVEIMLGLEEEEYQVRTATEIFYGARGHGGQGSDPGRLTRFAVETGFLGRRNYPGIVDLTKYNYQLGATWGRTGVPAKIVELCKSQNAGNWVTPKSVEETRDLLHNGYGGHSGQQLGFKDVTDSNGIFVPITAGSKAWNHDMAIVGMDYTKEFYPVNVFFIANSWAKWCQKPLKWPDDLYGPWPAGLIVCPENIVANVIVRTGAIYFFSNIKGYPSRLLPDWGFSLG